MVAGMQGKLTAIERTKILNGTLPNAPNAGNLRKSSTGCGNSPGKPAAAEPARARISSFQSQID